MHSYLHIAMYMDMCTMHFAMSNNKKFSNKPIAIARYSYIAKCLYSHVIKVTIATTPCMWIAM